MVNFRVRSLDAMVAQLQKSNIEVKVDPEKSPLRSIRQAARSGRQSDRAMGAGRPGISAGTIMMYAIKAEIVYLRVRTFVFTAQKTDVWRQADRGRRRGFRIRERE